MLTLVNEKKLSEFSLFKDVNESVLSLQTVVVVVSPSPKVDEETKSVLVFLKDSRKPAFAFLVE